MKKGYIICAGIAVSCSAYESDRKPNILFILSDDHAKSAISAYGGINADIAPTPNIDALAADGALFNNMICTNAISGPSRACLITGKYSTEHGFYQNEGGISFDRNQPQVQMMLKECGYETALFGKWHLQSEPNGFDTYMIHDKSQQGTYWNPIFNINGKIIRKKGYATTITADAALSWLDSRTDKDKPFCLMLNFKAPHRPWQPDSCYVDLYEDTDFPYPATFDDEYSGREKTLGRSMATMNHFSREDMKMVPPDSLSGKSRKKWLAYGSGANELWSPSSSLSGEDLKRWKFQKYIKDYFRTVKSVDDQVGRIVAYLKENGLYENTLIIYMGDQGFFLGEHGIYDKRWMYEESIQMPCIITFPRKIKQGLKVDALAANIDLAPTLLDYAGMDAPKDMQGESLSSLLSGSRRNCRKWRNSVYYQYFEYPKWHNVQPHYGVRTERFKLIHFYYDIDLWEFYDLKTDPYEVRNEIDNPMYQDVIEQLKCEIEQLQKKYGDDITLEERCKLTERFMVNYN